MLREVEAKVEEVVTIHNTIQPMKKDPMFFKESFEEEEEAMQNPLEGKCMIIIKLSASN